VSEDEGADQLCRGEFMAAEGKTDMGRGVHDLRRVAELTMWVFIMSILHRMGVFRLLAMGYISSVARWEEPSASGEVKWASAPLLEF